MLKSVQIRGKVQIFWIWEYTELWWPWLKLGLIWNQEIWKLVDPWYMIGDTVVEDINHHIISSRWYKLGTLPATELTKLTHGVTCSQTLLMFVNIWKSIWISLWIPKEENKQIVSLRNVQIHSGKKTISIVFLHKKFNVNETYQYISYILILHILYLGAVQVSCDRSRKKKQGIIRTILIRINTNFIST